MMRLKNVTNKISENFLLFRQLFDKIILLLVLGLILLLFIKAISSADLSWDVVTYHIPFIAMRMGWITSSDFVSSNIVLFHDYFHSFPRVADYLRGGLWWISGRPEAINLYSLTGFLLLVSYLKVRWKLDIKWTIIALLAIPLVQIEVSTAGVDFFTNAMLTIVILSVYRMTTFSIQFILADWVWMLTAGLLAAGSKPQAGPIVLIMYIVFLFVWCLFVKAKKIAVVKGNKFWIGIGCLSIVLLLTFLQQVLNTIKFGNPVYPMVLQIGSYRFPGLVSTGDWGDPQYLAKWPEPVRWLLSVLEWRAYELRTTTWTIDQGDVPLWSASLRMGGYNVHYMLMCFSLLAWIFIHEKDSRVTRLILFIIFISFIVCVLPGAHELRYFSFWMMVVVTALLIIVRMFNTENRYYQILGRGIVLISFLSVTFITGGKAFINDNNKYSEVSASLVQTYRERLGSGAATLCIDGPDNRFAILLTKLFNKNGFKQVIYRINEGECKTKSLSETSDNR